MSEELQQSQPVEQAPAGPSLSLQDLLLALQTIQIVAQRGAIKAEEMSTVGALHDKLYAFLNAQGVIAPAQAATENAAPQGGQDGTESSN